MSENQVILLREEIRSLRRAHQAQRWLLAVTLCAMAGGMLVTLGSPVPVGAQSTSDNDGILHIRGLVVEDAAGHERLRLGAPLPDPLMHGARRKRAEAVSGLVISDPNGNERGGYVTQDMSGAAFLTLDSEDDQEVLLLTNPKGGANFSLRDKTNSVQMLVFAGERYGSAQFPDGPKLTLSRAGKTLLDLPATPK